MNEKDILEKDYGMWGNIRKHFMYANREADWSLFLETERLDSYLTEIQDEFKEQAETLLEAELSEQGVTEELKERDPMAWIQRYNIAKENVTEIMRQTIETLDMQDNPFAGADEDEELPDLGPELLPDAKSRL